MTLLRLAAVLAVCTLMLFSTGCDDISTPTFTADPTITENPNPAVPLAAIVNAATNEPTVLDIQVSDGKREWKIPTPSAYSLSHSLPVLGLRPDRQHLVTVFARNEAGKVTASTQLEFTTAPLPDDFPALDVLVSNPAKMEPGVTLFALMRWPDGEEPDDEYGLAVAVDEQGEVVWYRRGDHLFEDTFRSPSDHLLTLVGYNRLEESDMLGNVVTSWHAAEHPAREANELVPEGSIPVATETFHHDIQQMPSGNLLVLSTEMRRIDDYPTSIEDGESATAPANVIGDVVVEFARDGTIVNEWKLMDLLDVRRLGYESLGGIWDIWAYEDVEGGTRDWSHGNSVFYHAEGDSILVSLRHQEAVISFSRTNGELNWILGTHDGWQDPWNQYLLTPEGDEFEWQFHQHAAEITADGSLIIFDNGNFRAFPPQVAATAENSYSRAVEYQIDAASKTVRQAWSYGNPENEVFYSPFISEADRLPITGNVLITDGGRIRDEQGRPSDQIVGGEHWARIVEVTHSDQPEKVFELVVDARGDDDPIGWAVYRSERLPSLYAN
jgi:hypothetical protein